MQIALLIIYPLCVHFAVTLQRPELQLPALVALAAGLVYRGIKHNSAFAWTVVAAVSVLALILYYFQLILYVLYVPPVVIPLLFCSVFYQSLLPDQTPLVTEIGESVHGPFDQPMRRYTRQVTVMWTAFFVVLAAWSALLPIVASTPIWSLFTNFVNYLLIALLFIAEFIYRKWRFRGFDHPDFWQYLHIVVRADIRKF